MSETNIAYPIDARLLNDSVRVLDRHLARLQAAAPELRFPYHRRTRRAKKRAYQIVLTIGDSAICRGKKGSKAEFGHKLHFATGRSGLITWYEVPRGNPGDNELLLGALKGHVEAFGQAPQKVTADRRYYSADNEVDLQPAAARGPPDADVVVVARAPGAGEKKTKRPARPRGNWARRQAKFGPKSAARAESWESDLLAM